MHDHANHSHAYDSPKNPTWCPGCGNFAIWTALKRAFDRLKILPHQLLMVYGVGCSGNMSNLIRSYGWHSLHGRALPTAIGAKLANGDLTVVVAGGDGDGYGEGLSHFIHGIRGNVDITYIVHNNSVYGLTTGQAAPTAAKGFKAKSTPEGIIEMPINPLALALAADASFVARGYAGRLDELVELFVTAIKHPGFSFVDVFQPCVTFNKIDTYASYYDRVYPLKDEKGYSASDKHAALTKAFETDRLPVGVFYQDAVRPSYSQELSYLKGKPLPSYAHVKHNLSPLMKEFI